MSTQPEKKENKLNELYEQGKAKGTMTYDEIITKLSTTDIDPDQFDTVLETLEAMGVEVIRDANSAEGPRLLPKSTISIFPCPRASALTTLCACI